MLFQESANLQKSIQTDKYTNTAYGWEHLRTNNTQPRLNDKDCQAVNLNNELPSVHAKIHGGRSNGSGCREGPLTNRQMELQQIYTHDISLIYG